MTSDDDEHRTEGVPPDVAGDEGSSKERLLETVANAEVVTTREVAARLDIPVSEAETRLEELEATGAVSEKPVGDHRIWWCPGSLG